MKRTIRRRKNAAIKMAAKKKRVLYARLFPDKPYLLGGLFSRGVLSKH